MPPAAPPLIGDANWSSEDVAAAAGDPVKAIPVVADESVSKPVKVGLLTTFMLSAVPPKDSEVLLTVVFVPLSKFIVLFVSWLLDRPDIGVFVAEIICPSWLTVNIATEVPLPYEPAVTAVLAKSELLT